MVVFTLSSSMAPLTVLEMATAVPDMTSFYAVLSMGIGELLFFQINLWTSFDWINFDLVLHLTESLGLGVLECIDWLILALP